MSERARFSTRAAVASVVMLGFAAAHAQTSVSLHGVMGQQAMLVIDGKTHVVGVGRSVAGVRVLAVAHHSVDVEANGQRQRLEVGARPVQLTRITGGEGGTTIVLPAGQGGHFYTQAMINGRGMLPFVVDTGATSIAMSLAHAQSLNLDLKNAAVGFGNTANGTVPVRVVQLDSVRIGDVTVYNVEAVVVPASMPHALLGNSFLSRFQMVRENDVLRLTKR